jgi:hypothetical protein
LLEAPKRGQAEQRTSVGSVHGHTYSHLIAFGQHFLDSETVVRECHLQALDLACDSGGNIESGTHRSVIAAVLPAFMTSSMNRRTNDLLSSRDMLTPPQTTFQQAHRGY